MCAELSCPHHAHAFCAHLLLSLVSLIASREQAAFEVADPNIQWEVYLGYIMAQWAVFRALGYLGAIAATRPSKGRAQATSTATEQSALLAGSANA